MIGVGISFVPIFSGSDTGRLDGWILSEQLKLQIFAYLKSLWRPVDPPYCCHRKVNHYFPEQAKQASCVGPTKIFARPPPVAWGRGESPG